MSNLGDFHYFLGILATQSSTGMFLSQQKYTTEILEHAFMRNCKPTHTHADLSTKYDGPGPPIDDPILYLVLV